MTRQHKKKKKRTAQRERDIFYAEDGQVYGKVLRMLGNSRCELLLSNGMTSIGEIRGRLKHRVWVRLNDLVLVSVRDFQDNRVDIIGVYSDAQARTVIDVENITFGDEPAEADDIVFDDI
jgi:translation initiation factor 1A